jgi:hypothetical protein
MLRAPIGARSHPAFRLTRTDQVGAIALVTDRRGVRPFRAMRACGSEGRDYRYGAK